MTRLTVATATAVWRASSRTEAASPFANNLTITSEAARLGSKGGAV